MKICVIGLGYIGLPVSIMFASHGCQVVGVDIKPDVVKKLNQGQIHIEEPGLENMLKECIGNGKFRACDKPEEADMFIIAVPTPNHKDESFSCDLTYVLEGVKIILPLVRKNNTVIIESTIAPRTMDDYIKPVFEQAGFIIGEDIYLAHCPERVLPGRILFELKNNNRIIGGITPACAEHAAKAYSIFTEGEIIRTTARTAELSKCMENTFRDVNIALANELAKICYDLDINCLDVIKIANKHPRVHIHQPGPGVGGHCLAVDPYFICAQAPDAAKLIRLARDTNCSMPEFVVEKTKMLLSGIEHPKIAAFGAAYKGNVNDMRESPALKVIHMLHKDGFQVQVFDPHIESEEFFTYEKAIDGADLILVLTDHKEYKDLINEQLVRKMRHPMIFDTKNIIQPQPDSGLLIINYGNLYEYKK